MFIHMISVVICTHNPREDYLGRAVEALKKQTLPREQWELVVIDNHSTPAVRDRVDLSWHPRARLIEEPELGLTPARLRGIREAHGELLVWVDDDNVCDENYLAKAGEIFVSHPQLGAWGGQVLPEFEVEPDNDCSAMLPYLGIRRTEQDFWCNFGSPYMPIGAGMCVRKEVARNYALVVQEDPRRKALDRKGTSLMSAGDFDMVSVSLDTGLGYGLFRDLRLTHLIPRRRVQREYLESLVAGCAASERMLLGLRLAGKGGVTDARSRGRRLFESVFGFVERLGSGRAQKLLLRAQAKGRRQAQEMLKSL